MSTPLMIDWVPKWCRRPYSVTSQGNPARSRSRRIRSPRFDRFHVGHRPTRFPATMSNTPKGVGNDDSLLHSPVERPLDDADDIGQRPVGLPFRSVLLSSQPVKWIGRHSEINRNPWASANRRK